MIDYVSSLPRNLTEGGVRQSWGLELVATSSATATTYVQHDHPGSVTQTTDATGNVTGTVSYDPWGAPAGDLALAKYTGHDWDSVLGVYFAQASVYAAQDRRFVSRDPEKGDIALLGSLIQYSYCINNALKYVDPSGLSEKLRQYVEGNNGSVVYVGINKDKNKDLYDKYKASSIIYVTTANAASYNLKQMAAALQYLQENNLLDYDALAAKAEAATERFHNSGNKLKVSESAMKHNGELKAAIADYARTRPIIEEYKSKKYSNKYLAEHEADITVYRAAQATMRELLNGEKLPKMDTLKAKWQTLSAAKKSGYRDYRAAQEDMREIVAVKANIDHLLGLTDRDRNKEQTR